MLRGHSSSVFVSKYYAPILLLVSTYIFWSDGFRWGQLVFYIPIFTAMLFLSTLAVLEIPDGRIRYRRLFGWTRIPYDEIVDCGVVWVFGYLRLKRFVFPWGRLYFVLDQNQKLFGRGDYLLLRYIQERLPDSHA
jgi:hypothetical protein